jgi:hypothetical protein
MPDRFTVIEKVMTRLTLSVKQQRPFKGALIIVFQN